MITNTVPKLREERAALIAEARDILDKAEKAKRDLTESERDEYDALFERINGQGELLRRMTGQNEMERMLETAEPRVTEPCDPNRSASTETARRVAAADPIEWRDSEGNPVRMLRGQESYFEQRCKLGLVPDSARNLSIGKALCAMVTGDWREAEAERRALAGGQDSAGGYALDHALSSKMIDLARSDSVVFSAGAVAVPFDTAEMTMLRVVTDPTAAWGGEGTTVSETAGTFGRLTFRSHSLKFDIKVSRELIQDAKDAPFNLEQQLRTVAGNEIDRVALLGSGGSSEPVGLFNATDVVAQTGGTLDYADLLDAIKNVEDNNGSPNAYIATPTQKQTLAKLLVNAEANHYAVAPDDVQALSRFVTTKLADTQLALGDFRQVFIGVRMNVTVAAVPPEFDSKDEWLIRTVWRGDVQFAQPTHLVAMTGVS